MIRLTHSIKKIFVIVFCMLIPICMTTPVMAQTTRSDHEVTKYEIRQEFQVAVAIAKSSFPLASDELNYSLNNNPSDRIYYAASKQANKIKDTKEYKSLEATIKSKLKTITAKTDNGSGSITISSDKDLLLAYHGMRYTYTAEKSTTGKWAINIVLTDTYDFEFITWAKYGPDKASVLNSINNYGHMAQRIGAIVPFHITVNMPTTRY